MPRRALALPRPPSGLLTVALALALAGCFTARAAVGPHTTSSGGRGLTATTSYGFGYSWRPRQAIYVTAGAGVSLDGFVQGLLLDSVDYVTTDARWPVRVSARFGLDLGRDRFHAPQRPRFGVGVAVFPWHDRAGGDAPRSEKGWTDVDLDLAANRGLGFELAIDALPATAATPEAPATGTAAMITLGLVGEVDGMLDR